MSLLQIASELIAAILTLSGASSPEELSEDELNRYLSLSSHPVHVNRASRGTLMSCGLFSPYQVASFLDYRQNSGDVLSLSELSSIDGFGKEFVNTISPFIGLDSYAAPGTSSTKRGPILHEGTVRAVSRSSSNLAAKYRISSRERWSAALSVKYPLPMESALPDIYGASAVYDGYRLKIAAGDFNCRFGQGLALWNGFSIAGFSSGSAFSKNPTGISAYWGFGENHFRGLSALWNGGNWNVCGLFSIPECLGAVNAGWIFRNGQISTTLRASPGKEEKPLSAMWSSDFRLGFKGVDLCGELCCSYPGYSVAFTSSACLKAGEMFRVSANAHYYPEDFDSSFSGAPASSSSCRNEAGGALNISMSAGEWIKLPEMNSGRRFNSSLSFEGYVNPRAKDKSMEHTGGVKTLLNSSFYCTPLLNLSARLLLRTRNYGEKFKMDAREDAVFDNGSLILHERLNYVRCTSDAFMFFAEEGYRNGLLSGYVREGIFKVDNWSDRIPVYERSAPGNFSVPSLYGRGFWFSALASCRLGKWGKLYIVARHTHWPKSWNAEEKPGKTELQFQLNIRITGRSSTSARRGSGRS